MRFPPESCVTLVEADPAVRSPPQVTLRTAPIYARLPPMRAGRQPAGYRRRASSQEGATRTGHGPRSNRRAITPTMATNGPALAR